jgi:hypothetical protein
MILSHSVRMTHARWLSLQRMTPAIVHRDLYSIRPAVLCSAHHCAAGRPRCSTHWPRSPPACSLLHASAPGLLAGSRSSSTRCRSSSAPLLRSLVGCDAAQDAAPLSSSSSTARHRGASASPRPGHLVCRLCPRTSARRPL